MLINFAKKLLSRFGYEIRLKGYTSKRIARLGCPKTIIDIGTGFGTPAFYDAFPEANMLLIEPVKEFEDHLKKICKKYKNCNYLLIGLGKEKGEKEINVNIDSPTLSSFLDRTRLTRSESRVEKRKIKITTLDDLALDLPFESPIGLKIDTEGFELDVIKGAENFLRNVDFVITEVSILKRFRESYSFEEFILEMQSKGFRVFDVLNVIRPDPSGTNFLDLVFVKSNKIKKE